MKKMMKRTLCLLLVAVMTFVLLPAPAQAASVTYVEVTKNDAPIRTKAKKTGSVVSRCEKGTILEVTGSTYNQYFNKWYKVTYDGKTRYIYSENVKAHTHDYKKFTFDDVSYRICSTCGAGNVLAGDKNKGALLLRSTSIAMGGISVADGPLPYGDMIAGGLALASIYYAAVSAKPAVSSLAKLFESVDFDAYLKKRSENVCTPESFRLVERCKGGLKYKGDECLDIAEAFVFAAAGHDVYTADEDMALLLVAEFGSGICERDKDKVSHFYHYHFGLDRSIKTHIFFGLNDLKQGPM